MLRSGRDYRYLSFTLRHSQRIYIAGAPVIFTNIKTMSEITNTNSNSGVGSKTPLSFSEVLNKAAQSAMRGGIAGACAMGANVGALMWMRTTMNYQVSEI